MSTSLFLNYEKVKKRKEVFEKEKSPHQAGDFGLEKTKGGNKKTI